MERFKNILKTSFGFLFIILLTTCNYPNTFVAVQSVSLDHNTLSLKPGSSTQLTATVTPGNAMDQDVSWSSSNTSVATVSDGLVTSIAPGSAKITAVTTDGNKAATCNITVTEIPVTSISLDKTTLVLTIGQQQRLTTTVSPSNATDTTITWGLSSPYGHPATISNGLVTAVALGYCSIEASAGGQWTNCQVAVVRECDSSGNILIRTADDLAKIGDVYPPFGHYKMMNDIDLSSYPNWKPLCSEDSIWNYFTGSFDGNGYTIDHLIIMDTRSNDGTTLFTGLFAGITTVGVVSNLTIGSNSNIKVNAYTIQGNPNQIIVGSIAGTNDGIILNCHNNATIMGCYVGGIVGYASGNSTIMCCSNKGTINANVGGGITQANNGSIIGCFNVGDINGLNGIGDGGGIVRVNEGRIIACYNAGAINDTPYSGGITEWNSNLVEACYNIGPVSGEGASIYLYFFDVDGTIASCYYGGNSPADSQVQSGVTPFSATAWPTADMEGWGIGDGTDGKYWKSLGGWNNGNSVYPKLWWEK
jgi:hypothetical protein